MRDPHEEARKRADEIYQRLLREMRSDLERMLDRAPSPPRRPVEPRDGPPASTDAAYR